MITGTDRTTYTGDVANKIGTYLKALAAHDCGVPFYVALPHPTIDGEWAKTARAATSAYLIIGFGEDSIDDAIAAITEGEGRPPRLVATSAKRGENRNRGRDGTVAVD